MKEGFIHHLIHHHQKSKRKKRLLAVLLLHLRRPRCLCRRRHRRSLQPSLPCATQINIKAGKHCRCHRRRQSYRRCLRHGGRQNCYRPMNRVRKICHCHLPKINIRLPYIVMIKELNISRRSRPAPSCLVVRRRRRRRLGVVFFQQSSLASRRVGCFSCLILTVAHK